MSELSDNFIVQCKEQLLLTKQDLLNRATQQKNEYLSLDTKGDEGDQTINTMAEHQFLTSSQRIRQHLLEIERALAKIQRGSYGVCEATEEPIESERLLAIPWTRFSIEGAEIIEAKKKRYAGPSA